MCCRFGFLFSLTFACYCLSYFLFGGFRRAARNHSYDSFALKTKPTQGLQIVLHRVSSVYLNSIVLISRCLLALFFFFFDLLLLLFSFFFFYSRPIFRFVCFAGIMALPHSNVESCRSQLRSCCQRPSSSSGSSSGSGGGSDSNSNRNILRPDSSSPNYDGSALRECCLSNRSATETPLLPINTSGSNEGSRLPSLMGSANSFHGSVVASLNEILVHNSGHHGKLQPNVRRLTPNNSSTSYMDNCRWATASIDVDTADTRKAIIVARGGKKKPTMSAMNQTDFMLGATTETLGSVRNPLAEPNAPITPPSTPKKGLAESGRKRSVCVNALPDLPSPAKPTTAALARHPSQQQLQQNGGTPNSTNTPQSTAFQQQQQMLMIQIQQQQQQQQQIMHMCLIQQQQQLRCCGLPAPLNENFVAAAQQQNRLLSSPASPRSGAVYPSAAELSETNNGAANDSTTLHSQTSLSSQSGRKVYMAKKHRFFLCAGKSGDIATDNRRK